MKLNYGILAFLVFGVFIGCQSTSQESVTQESGSLEQPKELVDRIQLVDLEGNDIALSSFRGKTIFLNYWATWCRPCLAEMPDMDKAAQVLTKEDFVFLAASDEDMDKIKKFASKNKYTFQFVHSKTSVFDLDIMALPTTMVIDKEGKIVYNQVGARDWSSDKEIESLRKFAGQ